MINHKLPPQRPARHVIHFNGNITPATVTNMKGTILQALTTHRSNPAALPVSEFYFMIASEGGDVNSGISLYNFLRGIQKPIIMHNFATIDSIAAMIFMAADTRYTVPSGRFILHSFSRNFNVASVDAPRLREAALSTSSYQDIYAACFKERIKNPQEPIDFDSIFKGEAVIMDDATALACGVVQKIVPSDGLIKADDVHWWVTS